MLIIKDFKWLQTEDSIKILLPIKFVGKEIDVSTHEKFVKIYAAPYYFEAFLLHPIIENESLCQLTKSEIRLCLKKAELIEWEKLERDFQDKAEKLRVKNEILEQVQVQTNKKLEHKLKLKQETKRSEVQNAMASDAKVRESIEIMKKKAIECEMSKVQAPIQTLSKLKAKPICEIPGIRKTASIEIQFSKRNFATPKRESQDYAEQQWILKQNEARKAIGFVPDDLRPEERDPIYLKKKGDEFFHQSNYLAAISAYSTGIKLTDKFYELFLNRSAAHLTQGNFQRCAEDCTKALELLNPPVASNLKARVQAIARRGAALNKIIRTSSDQDG
ncbi:CLUMA_CG005007, isoform A [Clunio marinus]|uniref:CLUMA_CG005007, isoform A n=1 Tax=Clunio marinus TaxID=568069 RepID=A0A1J1HTK7_9DIPT|nr:CLUMA_CG005007, isoform A [Clunio marinus]